MASGRTIYIFEGPDAVTICKGQGLIKNMDQPNMYNTKVKQKGLFSPYIPVMNIDEIYIGNAKKLMVSDRVITGWDVVRIKKDFLTHDSYIPDVPPNLIAQIKSLRNEIEIWKKKYFDAKRLNEDREQKDRFKGRINEDMDFAAKIKNKFYGSNDMFGGGFSSRWSLPPTIGGSTGGDES